MRGIFIIFREHDGNVVAQTRNGRQHAEDSHDKSKRTYVCRSKQSRDERARQGRDRLSERRPAEQGKSLLD